MNLFAGLLVDARGGRMTYSNRKHNPIVIPQNAVENGNATWVSFSAPCLERAILAQMRELTAKDVTDDASDAGKRLKDAETELAKLDARRDVWKAKMSNHLIADTVAEHLAAIETERQAALRERDSARRAVAAPAADAIDEIKTLADVLESDNSDEMRLKVRSVLRAAVESMLTGALGRALQRERAPAVRSWLDDLCPKLEKLAAVLKPVCAGPSG